MSEIRNPQSPIRNSPRDPAGLTGNALPRGIIKQLRKLLLPGSAIVCAGNELCGDDAAGLAVAGQIPHDGPWKVFEAGPAPENFLVRIAQSRPPSVLLIDAMDFGGEPGEVTLVDAKGITGQGPSTHGPGAEAFLELLTQMHACPMYVMGIQPRSSAVGAPLSEDVAASVGAVAAALRSLASPASN
jgi:hydrogenase 3 maturation protease